MSYNYSKLERNKVYADPEETVARYKVACTNHDEYGYKNAGYLILYLTKDKFIIRSLYDPDIFSLKGYAEVYFEIPFTSIIKITCCGEEFSQIISLSDFPQSNCKKNNISIEFANGQNIVQKLYFSINCYISLSKNAKECQELIQLFNKTVFNTNNGNLKSQEVPLFADKLYVRSPTLNINGKFIFKAYNKKIVFNPYSDNFEVLSIPIDNIISFTLEQNFEGMGTALSQNYYLKLVYKDNFNQQITSFIQFYLLNLNNAYPKKYIDFLTKLVDIGIIEAETGWR